MNNSSSCQPVIEVRQVYKYFKQVKAVDGIDLAIRPGQFTALLGPNGAGKTTLVEMIEGIQKPDNGDITIKGLRWRGNEERLHRAIGLSLQETRFIDKLTVSETLRLFSSFYQLSGQRIEEVIQLTGLQEKRKSYVVNLSGGQRQRLALGIALLNQPEILLLDEPTTGLDPSARREIWNILLQLREEKNTSLILTTHYMEEAEQLCDYIILMDHGKIIRQGMLDQLLQENGPAKTFQFTLQGDNTVSKILPAFPGFDIRWDAANSRGTLLIENQKIEEYLPRFFDLVKQNRLSLASFECHRMTLNDLFLSLTGRELHE